MLILVRTIIALGLCVWTSVGSIVGKPRTGVQGKEANHVEVKYKLRQRIISLHEPVVVLFEVHNRLSEAITLTLGAQSRQFFEFSLKKPNGQVLRNSGIPEAGVDIVTFGTGKATVEAGGDYKQALLMNQWFEFQEPGPYSLTVKLTTDIEVTGSPSFPVQSETLQIPIEPRDPRRLESVCASLLKQVENARNVEEAQFPARALSYVGDPVAVPYLAQVLSTRTLTYEPTVHGLERIGNDEAVEVLLSALDEQYGDIAEQAQWALNRMQDRIANPRLRETVKRELAARKEAQQRKP